MKYKSMILIILTVFVLVSIASVSASDANDTAIASEDTADIELSADNEIISEDNIQTSEEEIISADDTFQDKLSDNEGNYSELMNEIGNGGDVKLSKSYYSFDPKLGTIYISNPGVIDGNGAVIDMNNKGVDGAIFKVATPGVTFKNLTFKNANAFYPNNGGGAIRFSDVNGTVTDCNFYNNSASSSGGAIYFGGNATVTNCNFVGNSAKYGGAIYFKGAGIITNCNFTDNYDYGSYSAGPAIYAYRDLTISNSVFLNNKEEDCYIEVNLDSSTNQYLKFVGQNTYLNAISTYEELTLINVTYWGVNGITNSGSSPIDGKSTPKGAVGQNISISLFRNGKLICMDEIGVTDSDARVSLTDMKIKVYGEYILVVRHDENSYYPQKESIEYSGVSFNVNVTSMACNDSIVNITATSNIPNEIMRGELIFDISNGDKVVANYSGDGNWWALYTFDDPGEYYVSASFEKLDWLHVDGGTLVVKTNSSLTLDDVVLNYGESTNVTVTTNNTIGITAKIGDKDVVVDNYTIPISGLDAGNYILTVTTITDDNHNPVTKTATITVKKINSTLTVNDIVFDYGSAGSTSVSFTNATGVKASVVKQSKAVVDIKNDLITVSNLNAGTYTLSVTTITDANHSPVTKEVTITVRKVKSVLTASAITATYNVNKKLVVTLKDGNGKPISGVKLTVVFSKAKKVTLTTDKNGKAKVSTKGLAPKTYNAKITFENNNYFKSTKTVKVTVKKATPKLTAKAKSFKKSLKTKKYTITLKTNKNKALAKSQVTLKVKGTTYKATTNAKGKATFKLTKLNKKGKSTATITYKGSAYYNKVTKKVKINVK